MTEHKAGDTVALTGTIVGIAGDTAIVRVDDAEPGQGTVVVSLSHLGSGS